MTMSLVVLGLSAYGMWDTLEKGSGQTCPRRRLTPDSFQLVPQRHVNDLAEPGQFPDIRFPILNDLSRLPGSSP